MKRSIAIIAIPLLLASTLASASINPMERIFTVQKYLNNLNTANADSMMKIFTPDGEVVSTSQGRNNAISFFNGFLPLVISSKLDSSFIYPSYNAPPDGFEHYAARFHYTFELNDGTKVDGYYMDEFKFAKDSKLLQSVTMFENTHVKEM